MHRLHRFSNTPFICDHLAPSNYLFMETSPCPVRPRPVSTWRRSATTTVPPRTLAAGTRAVAVVKANGYGHGAIAVARALAAVADAFAVACIEEALELRESGIDRPILLLEGVFEPDELLLVDSAGLTPVIHSHQQLNWLLQARPARPMPIWLKMDSGMHRVGLAPEQFAAAHAALERCPHVAEMVLMSHFARADELDNDATERQLACFRQHADAIDAPCSLANSAAVSPGPRPMATGCVRVSCSTARRR
jgi:alanine racemase